jgi:hypothetical protein
MLNIIKNKSMKPIKQNNREIKICKHEWRQLITAPTLQPSYGGGGLSTKTFYCIHCLEIINK